MKEDIYKFSNPIDVYKNAIKRYGEDVNIKLSTRKDKKYMLLNPNTNTWVHFGQMGYEDYTLHRDKERRQRFLKRNAKWYDNDIYTPSYLSYVLLWI